MMTVSPLDNRFYLFNFFEPTNELELLLEKWNDAALYIKTKDHFLATYLHTSSDPKASYPVVNFAVNESTDICCYGKPDVEWEKMTGGKQARKFKGYPSGYNEVASYKGNYLTYDDKERNAEYKYFLTAVKVADSVDEKDFECNWKTYTGCDVIHKEIEGKGSVVDSHLYKRFQTPLSKVFKYVTRTEVSGLADGVGHVISNAANERAKPEGVETFTALYCVRLTHKHE